MYNKPTIKHEWRGLKGNKYHAWVIINHRGIRFVRVNKDTAYRQYNASMRAYKKLSK